MLQVKCLFKETRINMANIEKESHFNTNTTSVRHTNTNSNDGTWNLVSPILRIIHALVSKQPNNKIIVIFECRF
jgi:hypothetical protein